MDINTLIDYFNNTNILSIALKLFGIVFSILLIIFSIVIVKQVQVMRKTVVLENSGYLFFIALLIFLLSIGLVFYSIFVL